MIFKKYIHTSSFYYHIKNLSEFKNEKRDDYFGDGFY